MPFSLVQVSSLEQVFSERTHPLPRKSLMSRTKLKLSTAS